MRRALELGCNANAEDSNGVTPLMVAVLRQDTYVARFLLEKGGASVAAAAINCHKKGLLHPFNYAAMFRTPGGLLSFFKKKPCK